MQTKPLRPASKASLLRYLAERPLLWNPGRRMQMKFIKVSGRDFRFELEDGRSSFLPNVKASHLTFDADGFTAQPHPDCPAVRFEYIDAHEAIQYVGDCTPQAFYA